MDKYYRLHRDELVLTCANYCIQYNWSVREIARNVGVSKSLVQKLLAEDLKYLDSNLYNQCKTILRRRK